jgi:hypothetical protein
MARSGNFLEGSAATPRVCRQDATGASRATGATDLIGAQSMIQPNFVPVRRARPQPLVVCEQRPSDHRVDRVSKRLIVPMLGVFPPDTMPTKEKKEDSLSVRILPTLYIMRRFLKFSNAARRQMV